MAIVAMAGSVLGADWKPVGSRIKTRWAAKVTPANAWRQYPRPQMVRKDWQNLNGLWNYKVQPVSKKGEQPKIPTEWRGKILVPFCIESSLSGVGHILEPTEELWYQREVTIKKGGNRILMHFEAVDYKCWLWVNGKKVGSHTGGNTPFSFDITDAAVDGKNDVKLMVVDGTAKFQLLGKQIEKPHAIWYTRVSGIWQTVWLETVPQTYIKRIKIDTSINPGVIKVRTFAGGAADKANGVKVTASFKGAEVGSVKGTLDNAAITIKDAKLWWTHEPNLYDLKVELLSGGAVLDTVESYAGIRAVGKKRDAKGHYRFTLNGKFIFQLGPLDQGWFPDGLLTPASEEAMIYDIDYIRDCGFNFIRNHIKVRPRRYYYYCDKIGMMIWQDQVSGAPTPKWTYLHPNPKDADWPDWAHKQWMYELKEMMDYLHNSPSIVMWVPFNEAWGQHRTMEVGKWTVEYDPSRLVNIASGGNFWPVGDVADQHHYPHPKFHWLHDPRMKDYAKVVGEFGGHGYVASKDSLWFPGKKNWGYGGLPRNKNELLARFRLSMFYLWELKNKGIAGGVYTQTTDVEGEVNGLMTYDRAIEKFPRKQLKSLHNMLYSGNLTGEYALPMAHTNSTAVKYTTSEPKADWFKPGFDDGSWTTGPAGLGNHTVKHAVVKTKWDSGNIWYRTTFDFDKSKGIPWLHAFFDENPVIYINGIKAAELKGYSYWYLLLEISPQAKASLKPTGNNLAVKCDNAEGGQYIDVAIAYSVKE
ncbi:MAG: glycoside hydrolase family 2 TIM barrel-domain containing protein [Kiritimatiellia bacterium]|nr:glycoside hydrolase family 2 TIM barrel-domain containing protein [Kiritimatiellia bacterium]